jgi:glycosyltransferase involved in cell wall biosynthesis
MSSAAIRVLIIPSWYPTTKNHLTGSFFREQAALLQPAADVKVLYGRKREITRAGFYAKRIRARLAGTRYAPERCDAEIIAPPQPVGFWYDQVKGLPEVKNYHLMLFQYQVMLEELLAGGWRPDLIHAHATEYGGILAWHLGRLHTIPTLITEHQLFLLHDKTEFVRRKTVQALEGATRVAAVSHHQLRSILMHDIRCNAVVTGNFIDADLFSLRPKERGNRVFSIISVTYPSFIKDNETFFRAIAHLVRKGHTDIRVTVIGNNAFSDLGEAGTDDYERLAGQYGVRQYCNFISFVDRAALPAHYHESDLFVSTSIAETFGVAIREAMAAGLPVVSTANGGIDDTLNESNGIRVNVRDYEAVADAVIRVKTGAVTFHPEAVRQSVVEQYGREAFAAATLRLYRAVADEKLTG